LGAPDVALARAQHAGYVRALEECGLAVTRLAPDERHPDSTFVEDTAIVTARGALLTRPGVESRRDEVAAIGRALAKFFPAAEMETVRAPGTLDAGDVCDADGHFFIGVSERTNEEGARQLADWLARREFTSAIVDIRALPGLLHLKSGLAHLGGRRLAAVDALAEHPALRGWELLRVPAGEDYAANCVRVNDAVLAPAGFPQMAASLRALGLRVVELDVSEFRKMDGGLSCLSLRW
jgi:dimethylargininase